MVARTRFGYCSIYVLRLDARRCSRIPTLGRLIWLPDLEPTEADEGLYGQKAAEDVFLQLGFSLPKGGTTC